MKYIKKHIFLHLTFYFIGYGLGEDGGNLGKDRVGGKGIMCETCYDLQNFKIS